VEDNNWPPSPAKAPRPDRERPWWRRRWVLVGAGAVAAVTVVGLVVPTSESSSVRPAGAAPAPTTSENSPAASTPPTTAAPTTDSPSTAAATTADPTSAAPTAVVTLVIDGDAIVIDSSEHVRLIGIDIPERGDCGYDEATANMRSMVYGKAVILTAGARDDVDGYGRLLRYVDLRDGTDTGLAQISAGLAVARYDSRDGYGHHPREQQYVAADSGAAATCIFGTGASATAGPGQRPAGRRVAPNADGSCPPEAPIKGNADSGIYHRPGQQAYNKTKAEDCFATPADAEAAGYRAAKR
jgi:micrococcal nuclease